MDQSDSKHAYIEVLADVEDVVPVSDVEIFTLRSA